VLGYGEGAFKGDAADAARLNLVNPLLRNTAVIFPYGWKVPREAVSCGATATALMNGDHL
jgi:L-ascorbate oxidase